MLKVFTSLSTDKKQLTTKDSEVEKWHVCGEEYQEPDEIKEVKENEN